MFVRFGGLRSAHRGFARAMRGVFGTVLLLTMALQPGAVSPVLADPASPLQVTKTANPSPVTSGALLTYTISIKNTSGAKVDSVVMTDQVNGVGTIQAPPGLPQLTITSTQGPCTQGGANGNVVTCQIGTINGQGSATITITGQVTAAGNTNLQNTASVTGTKSAQNFTTNASVTTFVNPAAAPKPDLTLNKTGPTSVPPSTNMVYTLTVNNIGNANTANVKVVDTLPVGMTLQAPTPFETTSLFSCSNNAPPPGTGITVVCQGGTVNASQNATIKINAISPSATGQITNTAIVDPDNTIAESNELNNSAAAVNTNVTSAPPTPTLTIFKTDNNPTTYPWSAGAGPDPVNPGQLLTYKIQVKNTSATRADDVVITDGTQALETSSITVSQVVANGTVGNGGGCTVNGAQVRCLDRTLNAGGTITVTISGIVVVGAGANIFNTATVTGNIKNQGVQASAQESTTVRPAVDLTITKAGPASVCARTWPTTSNPAAQHLAKFPPPLPNASGDIPAIGLLKPPACLGGLTYHFVVGNSGQLPASGVAIRDWLPAGVIFDSYQSSMPGLTCSVNTSNVIDCTGGALLGADTQTIDILVVAPPTLGTITNTVTVDPNNAIFEPDETNNDATTTTDVTTGIDLVIFKSDKKNVDPPGGAPPLSEGFDPIATAGTGTYTIIVDNVGTQDATGIKVRDTLPAGTKFLSVTSDQGFTCSHDGSATGGNVTCISGHLRGTMAEFYQRNGTPPPPAPGDEFATIKIKFFATPFVQQVGQLMHNEVRVDPDNEIAEANELNNLATDDTVVTTGNDNIGAFNQLTVDKTQVSPASNGAVATNGILKYNLHVSNLGTDPVSNVVLQDFLPAGSRFISATDVTGGPSSAKFFCTHDGSATGGTITCVGGDFSGSVNIILPGPLPTSRDVEVKIFAPNTPQTAVNTTTVDPNNIVPEGNEFDNDDDQTTAVAPCTSLGDCTTKNAVYELTIVKDQNRPTIARNGLETYTLLVSNWGSDPVSGITVKDTLPAGTRFFDAKDTAVPPSNPAAFTCSHDGSPSGGTVTCVGGVLSGSSAALALPGVPTFRTIQIRAFMPDTPGTYTNRAVVDPSNATVEGNEFNNESSIETVVQNGGPNPYIDLQVDKTQEKVLDQDNDNPAGDNVRVDTGQGILYMLHVTNTLGEGDAFNVSVRDVIPAGTTFFSAADTANTAGAFTCTFSSPNIDCTGGTIPAGGSRDIKVVLIAPTGLDKIASDPGKIRQTLTNQAFVDPFNAIGEGNESNNSDVVQTIVESQANLTLEKHGPTGASQNETTEYTITATNNITWGDGRTLFGVKIVDPLPVGLIPIGSVEATGNFTCTVEENPVNTVTCIGDLAAGGHVDITIHVFITADGGTLDNEACVDPDHVIDETSELDNCQTAITQVTPPSVADLATNKSADKGTVTAGETLTYTVAVINQGTAAISGSVTVSDPLPSQVTFVSVNPDAGWTCTGGATVNCNRTGLAAGATSNIKIEVTVNSGATGPFTNDATVTGNGQTKHGTVSTSVGGAPIDLAVAGLSDSPDPANVGQNITYSFAVTNGGSSPSGTFDIAAKMDSGALSGLDFVGASASQGFNCGAIVTDTVTCSGSLLAGQSTNVTIVFQVLADTPTSHTLAVEADSGHTVAESSEANNTASETTTVTSSLCTNCVDLVAGGILVTPDPVVAPGGSVTRVATVSNAGDISTAAHGANTAEVLVAIDGTLEDFDSASASLPGFTCSGFEIFGTIFVSCAGDLGAGQGVAVTVNTTVAGASDGDTLFASVSADPNDEFPEGSGDDFEFTNANNDVSVFTNVVAP